MSRRARPSLAQGVAAAFAASLSGAALLAVLSPAMGAGSALRVVIALLGLAYLLYLLSHGGNRTGRLTALVSWMLGAALVGLTSPPLAAYVLVHVGMLWLLRTLYFRARPLPALADLGLTALAAAFGAWAALRSGSALLALWCFFLVQAFFAAIPPLVGRSRDTHAGSTGEDAPGFEEDARAFDRAYRTAEAALGRLGSAR
jgi:hypothetical protein